MKRAALAEILKIAELPTFVEKLRDGTTNQMPVIVYAKADSALDVSVCVGYGHPPGRNVSFTPPQPGFTAAALSPAELRRLADIRDAIDRWKASDADWPTPKVSP